MLKGSVSMSSTLVPGFEGVLGGVPGGVRGEWYKKMELKKVLLEYLLWKTNLCRILELAQMEELTVQKMS